MKRIAIVFAAVALVTIVFSVFRYDYLQRGEQALRVDRLTGRTYLLRPVKGGGADWVALRTKGDIAKEAERCAVHALPSGEARKVEVDPAVTHGDGPLFDVTNGSSWAVHEIRVAYGDRVVSVRLDNPPVDTEASYYQPPQYILTGAKAAFRPTQEGRGFGGDFRVTEVLGTPGDCHS